MKREGVKERDGEKVWERGNERRTQRVVKGEKKFGIRADWRGFILYLIVFVNVSVLIFVFREPGSEWVWQWWRWFWCFKRRMPTASGPHGWRHEVPWNGIKHYETSSLSSTVLVLFKSRFVKKRELIGAQRRAFTCKVALCVITKWDLRWGDCVRSDLSRNLQDVPQNWEEACGDEKFLVVLILLLSFFLSNFTSSSNTKKQTCRLYVYL